MNAPLQTSRFEEAVEWFRRHLPDLRDADFEAMLGVNGARARRWTAKAQLDLVTQVWLGIDEAVAEGATLADFQARMVDAVRRAWGSTATPSAHRVETVFRDNIQRAFAGGRHEMLTRPEVLESHPFWRFSAIRDMRTSDLCVACSGTILPASHPWWGNHQPPLHHRCRSTIIPMRKETARRRGITKHPTEEAPPEGFGNLKEEPPWKPKRGDYPEALLKKAREKAGPARSPPKAFKPPKAALSR